MKNRIDSVIHKNIYLKISILKNRGLCRIHIKYLKQLTNLSVRSIQKRFYSLRQFLLYLDEKQLFIEQIVTKDLFVLPMFFKYKRDNL